MADEYIPSREETFRLDDSQVAALSVPKVLVGADFRAVSRNFGGKFAMVVLDIVVDFERGSNMPEVSFADEGL